MRCGKQSWPVRYPIGSSTVVTLPLWELSNSPIAAYRVVLFPLPVGPVSNSDSLTLAVMFVVIVAFVFVVAVAMMVDFASEWFVGDFDT